MDNSKEKKGFFEELSKAAFPELDYIYGEEAKYYSFVSVPKELISGRYKDLSPKAQVLYIKMLDRLGLSIKNGWKDDKGRTYIYYTLEAVMEDMNCGHNTATKLIRELDAKTGVGLIERVKQGQGKPARIYVKSITRKKEFALDKRIDPTKLACSAISPEVQKGAVWENRENSAFPRSAKRGSQDCLKGAVQTAEKGQQINTNMNNTEFNNHHPTGTDNVALPMVGSTNPPATADPLVIDDDLGQPTVIKEGFALNGGDISVTSVPGDTLHNSGMLDTEDDEPATMASASAAPKLQTKAPNAAPPKPSFTPDGNPARASEETNAFGAALNHVRAKIDYASLLLDSNIDRNLLKLVVDIAAEVNSSDRAFYTLNKRKVDAASVRECFSLIDRDSVLAVMKRLGEYGPSVNNMRRYVFSALYNELQAKSRLKAAPLADHSGRTRWSRQSGQTGSHNNRRNFSGASEDTGSFSAVGKLCGGKSHGFPERQYTQEQYDEIERKLLNI